MIRIHPALRPILTGILLFAALNLILTAGVTFSPLNARFNFKYGNFLPAKLALLKQQPQPPDVLFLGTSQTNNGFIPAVFEAASGQAVRSFNLGLPNNRYDIMLGTLRLHQRRFGKPRMVLVELSPSIQERDSYLYYLPALYYRTLIEQDPGLAPELLANPLLSPSVKKELALSSFSSLRQYRFTFSPVNLLGKVGDKLKDVSGRFQPATANAEAVDTATPADKTGAETEARWSDWMAKGWYPKEQSPHMATPEGVRQSVLEARRYYIDQQTEVSFDKLSALLDYCRSENIPVVLVGWPNHPAFLKEFQASRLSPAYRKGLAQLLRTHPVPVIDLNRDIPASQSETESGLFSDPRHLTPDGARLFSEILAGRLSALPETGGDSP